MRILVLSTNAFGANGGIAKYNDDLLTALDRSLKISEVMVLARETLKKNVIIPSKISYNPRSSRGKFTYLFEILLVLLKLHNNYDLIICAHINLLPLAYIISKVKRIPLWCELYGIDAWQPHRFSVINQILSQVSKFITISQYSKRRFTDWSRVLHNKVHLLPPSFSPDEFDAGTKPTYLLERYNLKGKTLLLTLGRLNPQERYKGFDEVMEILPKLIERIPNIVYIIAGEGEDEGRLKNKALSLGIQDRVIFTGYISADEKNDHYRLADAFVMPGRGEGFGIVYLEAMACGIPVVASKADGSRDAVRNGKLGILVDPDKPEEIVKGILDALKNKTRHPPVGLDYFSFKNFQIRLNDLLAQEFFDVGLEIDGISHDG